MENQNQEPKTDDKEQIKVLESEMKAAFKESNFDAMKEAGQKLLAIDAENRLAKKLTQKMEAVKVKEKMRIKKTKVKEYETMLKKLVKEDDLEKAKALAEELKTFAPENKSADKWLSKIEKLEAKKSGAPTKEEGKEQKPGLFARLFAKKKVEEKPEESKPESTSAEVAITPATTEVAAPVPSTQVPAEQVSVPSPTTPATSATAAPVQTTPPPATPEVPVVSAAPEAEKEAKGNLFTKIFKKEKEETNRSIIDTIVAKSDKKEEAPKAAVPKKKERSAAGLLTFSKAFMNFTAIFVVFSAGFLYVEFIDQENTMLSLVGISENTGSRLHKAGEEVQELHREEAVLEKDIELYKGGYSDTGLSTVENIIEERINWPDIFAKINEVTNSVYELNDFFKYIEYNNYAFDAERGTIRVTGTLSDPAGKNLTRLVELEEAFKYFPKDKNNPDDPTQPYFQSFQEFTSFSKSLDRETGRFTSSFQLSFALNK